MLSLAGKKQGCISSLPYRVTYGDLGTTSFLSVSMDAPGHLNPEPRFAFDVYSEDYQCTKVSNLNAQKRNTTKIISYFTCILSSGGDKDLANLSSFQ